MKINKGKVELQRFEKIDDNVSFVYLVKHNNGKTSVDQLLTINGEPRLFNENWSAQIAMDDFPPQDSPEKAALKLADWLERLAAAIRVGEYQPYKRAEFKVID